MASYDLLNALEKNREDQTDLEWDDIIDYPVSVGVDIGTSIVNSFSWLTDYKVETSTALAALNTDMADFYENHRDAVELGSFIGGIFVPMGAGRMVSSAMKFAGSGKVTALAQPFKSWDNKILGFKNQAADLIRTHGQASAVAKKGKRIFQQEAFKKGLAEAIAYETSFASLYNGHAYLDGEYDVWDYALGVGLGAGIGGVGVLMSTGQFRKISQSKQAADLSSINSLYTPGMSIEGRMSGYGAANGMYTIKAQQSKLDEAIGIMGKDTRELVEKTLNRTKVATGKHIHEMLDTKLQDIGEVKAKTARPADLFDSYDKVGQWEATPFEIVTKVVRDNPEALIGVDEPITFFTHTMNPFKAPAKDTVMRTSKGKHTMHVPDTDKWLATIKQPPKSIGNSLYTKDPEGVISRIEDSSNSLVIRFDDAKMLDKPDMFNYVTRLITENPGRRVRLNATLGEFSSKFQKLQAPTKDLPYELSIKLQGLTGMEEVTTMASKFQYKETRVVIDTWNGTKPVMMDALEASVTRGVASNLHWRADTGYDILRGTPKKGFMQQSVYEADEDFLNAIHAYERVGHRGFIANQVIEADDLARMQAALIYSTSKLKADPKLQMKLRIEKDIITTVDDLGHRLFGAKVRSALTLLDDIRGFTNGQIAKKINGSVEFIESIVEDSARLRKAVFRETPEEFYRTNMNPDIKHIMYNDLDHAKFLNAKPLLLEGEGMIGARARETQIAANLDKETLVAAHRATIEEIMTTSSLDVQEFFALVAGTKGMQALRDNVNALATRGTMGAYNFTSRDFTMRALGGAENTVTKETLGNLADIISTEAKAFNSVVINFLKSVTDAVQPSFKAVDANPVARTLFYQFRQTLDALPSNQLDQLIYEPLTGKIATKLDGNGKAMHYLRFLGDDTKEINLHIAEADGTIQRLMETYLPVQDRYLRLNQANSKLIGGQQLQGRGIWFPRKPIDDTFLAYIVDKTSHEPSHVTQIVGRSLDDLETRINHLNADLVGTSKTIVNHAELKDTYNHLYQYAKLNDLKRADTNLAKRGIALDEIPVDGRGFQEILDGLSTEAWTKFRNLQINSNPELFKSLDDIIKTQTSLARSSTSKFFLKKQAKLETAELTKKTLLNFDLTKDFHEFEQANNVWSSMLDKTIDTSKDILSKVAGKASIRQADYDSMMREVRDAGLPDPYKSYTDYIAQARPELVPKSQAFIAQASSVMVAANLRFLDASHAIVTTLSTPVILAAELKHQQLPMMYIMEGLKLARGMTDDAAEVMGRGYKLGYAKPHMSEIDDLMYNLAVAPNKVQKALDSSFIKLGSIASDSSERITREVAYATGYRIAQKKLGPNAARELLEASAFSFTNRTMGNYTTRQRPTVFQGTLGATIGLYQTFMMTMAQQMFRFMEAGDKAALVRLFGLQAGMFGTQSLPGYGVVNDVLGAWVNDKNSHQDLNQTIYNALGDDTKQTRSMAEMILYGFPAWASQTGFHTRAEINPRAPLGLTRSGLEFAPPLINATIELFNNAVDTAKTVGTVAGTGGTIDDVGRAALEGVASQFLWRPGARMSELILGHSRDRAGTVLSTGEDMEGIWPTLARVLGSRPLKEQSLRQIKFYGKYYDSIDSQNKRQAIRAMKSMVAGESTASIGGLFEDYTRAGGTIRGWSQAMQQAYMSSDTAFADKLADQVNKQPGIYDIVNSYAY